tara:strand:+ start:9474 stop:9593 length:120 start_codon:yes stop_codon:yes gene_type:complete
MESILLELNIMENFRDILYFMAGFFTTFCLGYMMHKGDE